MTTAQVNQDVTGASRRCDQEAQSFEMWTGGSIDAILKSGLSDDGVAIARPWRPICEVEWATADPGCFPAPSEIEWGPRQLFARPRIARGKLRRPNFQFDRTQAIANLPDASQDTAHKEWKGKIARRHGGGKGEGSCADPDEEEGKGQMKCIVDWGVPAGAPFDEAPMDGE